MYKKQMKFQKLICFIVLLASVILFIYSLGFVTDLYDALTMPLKDDSNLYDNKHITLVDGAEIYIEVQGFNKNLTTAAIILILCSVAMFLTNTHVRRRYYIGNFVTIGVSTAACLGVSVWNIINVAMYKKMYQTTVDFDALKIFAEEYDTLYIDKNSTFWFDIGFVVSALLIIVAAVNIFNLIWKIKLMKEEAQLINTELEGSSYDTQY